MIQLFKYSGAGNDFIIADARFSTEGSRAELIRKTPALCNRNSGFRAADGTLGADGLMLLCYSLRDFDFEMDFFNPDGSTSMMCGNGGRCIVAFAARLGIVPAGGKCRFLAPDGPHTAEILSSEGPLSIVRLGMKDTSLPEKITSCGIQGWFLDTGTRHFVAFSRADISQTGCRIRHDRAFAPEGTNVNFVTRNSDGSISIRTFEKGVEAETLACGTGITAAAIVSHYASGCSSSDAVRTLVHARIADLTVEFIPSADGAREVFLTGPALEVTSPL